MQSEVNKIASDNPYLNYQIGDEIAAITAINWINGSYGQDCRPKIYDNKTKSDMLLDTGAMTSCIAKTDSDKIDPNITLRTASGTPMKTYGSKVIDVRIGRKTYSIKAVITDVNQTILGMDLIAKYKLGFEWIADELHLIDKKAQSKHRLKFVTLAHNSLPGARKINSLSSKFEFDCMDQIAKSDKNLIFKRVLRRLTILKTSRKCQNIIEI